MPTQSHRLIAITTPLSDDELVFYKAELSEELGQPFHFDVELLSENDHISLDDLLGQNVTIRLENEDVTRYFNGFVTEFKQQGIQGGYSLYSAVIKPWFWLLNLSENCRIFQDKTYPEIIKEIFDSLGFSDYEDKLTDTYKPVDYVVQFNESDFNFVSRILEQEGIYYYFEHINGKHTMVLVDNNSNLTNLGEISYFPPEDDDNQYNSEVITHWDSQKRVRTSSVRLIDYDFELPSKNLEAVSSVPTTPSLSAIEKFNYPGKYKDRTNGTNYTRLLMERENASFETKNGQTMVRGLFAGSHFTLLEHYRDDQNIEHLLTSVNLTLYSDNYLTQKKIDLKALCKCSFTAIPANVPFRSQVQSVKPKMSGPQTAIVVGKDGEEIWTDKYGRVKVLFHWDRYAKADEKSSCWIRVSQSWAGKGWGTMQIPRVGQEVLVDFLHGDPDKPIIVGCIYNGSSMPPYPLPANATRSGVKSRSSKGGAGFNEIRFEDKKDSEQLFIHAQYNHDVRVKNDQKTWVGNDAHHIVKGERLHLNEKDNHETYKANDFRIIDKNAHLKVGGNFFTVVTKTFNATYVKDLKVSVGGDANWTDKKKL